MAYLVVYAALTMAGVFGAAAALKIRRRHDFASSIVALGLVPVRAAGAVATAVIAVEAATALACVVAPTRLGGLGACVVLLGAFAAVAERAARRPPVPCRCFGSGTVPLGRRHVARNLILAALAGAGLIGAVSGATAVSWPAVALCLPGAVVTTALVVRADDLIDLFADLAPTRPQELP